MVDAHAIGHGDAPPPSRLSSPLVLRGRTLRNRVVMTPTSNVLARDRLPTEAQAAFYAARAAGGVAMIVSEGLRVHPTNCGVGSIGTFNPAVVDGLRRIAARVREHGVPIIGQVMHGGRQSHQHVPHLLWAPSAVACPYSGYVPHAMTLAEVAEMRDHFVTGALRVQDAGWDGVELHGAQGHLVGQFLSPLSNVRTDRYGGDFDGRLMFALEVLHAIRERCGPDFLLGMRLPSSEFAAGGIDVPLAARIAAALEARADIDWVSIAQGNFMSIATHIPDRREPPHPYADQTRVIRAALTRVPVIASSRIRTPDEAETLLANGTADLIGLTRALVSDPDWPAKAVRGDARAIRECIYCNVCWHAISNGSPIACVQNPHAGREAMLAPIVPADVRRRVLVVGGGPAGLAAAEAAAERGHVVTLVERSRRLGGQLMAGAQVPGDEPLAKVIDHLEARVRRLGVRVVLGEMVGTDAVEHHGCEAVIVATGSTPQATLPFDPGAMPVFSAVDAIERHRAGVSVAGKRIVLIDRDGYFATWAVAEMLALGGAALTLVTWHMSVGHDLPLANLSQVLGRLDRLGVELRIASEVDGISGRAIRVRHVYSGRTSEIEAVDAIVICGGHRAESQLAEDLRARHPSLPIRLIGDALAPRALKDAIHEGHQAGRI